MKDRRGYTRLEDKNAPQSAPDKMLNSITDSLRSGLDSFLGIFSTSTIAPTAANVPTPTKTTQKEENTEAPLTKKGSVTRSYGSTSDRS